MSILKKINEIRKQVAYVKKDATVGFGKNAYKAVTHDAVTDAVRQHFIDNGVIIVPVQKEKGVSVPGKTQSGNDKIRFEAMYDVKFIDMESESEIIVTVEAHAEDSGDKAAGKALSYATKSAILKVLMLETGEDDEEGIKNKINAKQAGMIAQLITDTKSDMKKFMEAYNIEKIADLTEVAFPHALAQLQAKKQKIDKGEK